MKNKKTLLALILAMTILFTAGCVEKDESDPVGENWNEGDPSNEANNNVPRNSEIDFDFSEGIDENGYYIGITALDMIEMFDYKNISIPADVHMPPESFVQEQINRALESVGVQQERKHIMNRAVQDGDRVNIDYIGSIDGVEFSGGNSGGRGADVTAGTPQFIDDFLWQIIGMMPGDAKDIHVTFPDPYNNPDLAGKNAVFYTTINYIFENEELTDEFIADNFSEFYGWTTLEEMIDEIVGGPRRDAIENYIFSHLIDTVKVIDVPDVLIEIQEKTMVFQIQNDVASYGIDLKEYLSYYGFSSMEEAVIESRENNRETAIFYLILQAIAEDMELVITEDDLTLYFSDFFIDGDYSHLIEDFGLPYLKQAALRQTVIDYLIDNVVLL